MCICGNNATPHWRRQLTASQQRLLVRACRPSASINRSALLMRVPSHILRLASAVARRARESEPIVLFLLLFAAARVPARCASSALSQKNIPITINGAYSSLWIDFESATAPLLT
jgi:hypothetical protein